MEIIVVVTIVAVLAVLALPNFAKTVERNRVKDAETTLNIIFQAERIYKLDNGVYGDLASSLIPPTNHYLDANPSNGTWTYGTALGTANATYTATATRAGSGDTILLDNTFTGSTQTASPYNGHIYGGSHNLRD